MSSRPAQPGPANIKIKTRKRNAVSKFEPNVFRDSFITLIKDVQTVEEYETLLFSSVDDLDYKKYGDPLFELMIVGCLVLPGGILSTDDALRNRWSIFDVAKDDWETMRVRVEVINKLVRRYKYLQLKV
jgi:hypothetical protein